MANVERIRRLNDALVRECQRYTLDEALNALAAVSAGAISTLENKEQRVKAFTVFQQAVVNSLRSIEKHTDPLLTEKVLS